MFLELYAEGDTLPVPGGICVDPRAASPGRPTMKNTARKKKLQEVEPVVQLTLADVIHAVLREFVIAAGECSRRQIAPDVSAGESVIP